MNTRCELSKDIVSINREDKPLIYISEEAINLKRDNDKLKKEVERLNNIINELERYINEEYIYDELGMKIFDASKLQDKLQELKGVDKE